MAGIPVSTNRWPVFDSQRAMAGISFTTGQVAPGDPYTILNYLCERYHKEVEPIRKNASWGWAKRPVRGQSSGYSNHASGTAVDINADDHVMGKRGTFTTAQIFAVRRILDDIGGSVVVFWGEDYRGRVDGMHFELNSPPGDVRIAAAARRIRALKNTGLPSAPKPKPVPPPKPAPKPKAKFSLGNVLYAIKHPRKDGNVAIIQKALNSVASLHGAGVVVEDGWWGPKTQSAFNAYRRRVLKLSKIDDYTGVPGKYSVGKLLPTYIII